MATAAKKKKHPKTDEEIELSDIPELTAAQWNRARPGTRGKGKRLELTLESVRKAFAKTQVDVAKESGIQQADVSRLENKESLDEVLVGTLRRYTKALGGELELVVVAPNGARIIVKG